MLKFAANLSMMFAEAEFLNRFNLASENGFKGVEYLFPYDYDAEQLSDLLKTNNLIQVLYNLPAGNWAQGDRGIACDPNRVDEFKDGITLAVKYATKLQCGLVNCLAGIKPDDVSHELAEKTFVSNLQYAAPILAKIGVNLIIESINTRDISEFYLNNTKHARSIIEKVNHPNLFLQHDIYHMQIMEGDLARTIENNIDFIKHIQLADNPGRHEPGTGEINYDYLLPFINNLNYDGWIGCEYVPETTTDNSLRWLDKYK